MASAYVECRKKSSKNPAAAEAAGNRRQLGAAAKTLALTEQSNELMHTFIYYISCS